MARYNLAELRERESTWQTSLPANVAAFVQDILDLYEKHDLAISHEDGHGAFEIVTADEFHAEWLANASDKRPDAEATRFQRMAAIDHAAYQEMRAAGDDAWAVLHGRNAADAFRAAWWKRFGTREPEAWA